MKTHKRYTPYTLKWVIVILAFLNTSFYASAQTGDNKPDSLKTTGKKVPMLPVVMLNNKFYKDLKITHPQKATGLLPDSDGDGITDQFDLEPNTPKGADVDTHGRAVDTDGDSVPDWKDKEKLTRQECFPTDTNGVGVCPDPSCCREYRQEPDIFPIGCALNDLPSIKFKPGSITLDKIAKQLLDSLTGVIAANPACRIFIKAYVSESSEASQQVSWDKAYTVLNYLVETKGLSYTRFIFSFAFPGDADKVTLEATTSDGPYFSPAPYPRSSKIKNLNFKEVEKRYHFTGYGQY